MHINDDIKDDQLGAGQNSWLMLAAEIGRKECVAPILYYLPFTYGFTYIYLCILTFKYVLTSDMTYGIYLFMVLFIYFRISINIHFFVL